MWHDCLKTLPAVGSEDDEGFLNWRSFMVRTQIYYVYATKNAGPVHNNGSELAFFMVIA